MLYNKLCNNNVITRDFWDKVPEEYKTNIDGNCWLLVLDNKSRTVLIKVKIRGKK
jgi:hypothetical protein